MDREELLLHASQRVIYNEKIENAKKRQERFNADVKDWAEFSLNPQSEDDIRKRILDDKKTFRNSVCISYICANSVLSEEFIEELIQLTKVSLTRTKFNQSRVDWFYISSRQKLSEEFIERHSKDVYWNLIFQNQKLSKEFKLKHIDKMDIEDQKKLLSQL